MNRLLITIFVILLVPAFGLPVEFDRWIYGLLVLILGYFLYTLLSAIKNKEVAENPTNTTQSAKKNKSKKVTKEVKSKKTASLISKEEKESIKKAVKESN